MNFEVEKPSRSFVPCVVVKSNLGKIRFLKLYSPMRARYMSKGFFVY